MRVYSTRTKNILAASLRSDCESALRFWGAFGRKLRSSDFPFCKCSTEPPSPTSSITTAQYSAEQSKSIRSSRRSRRLLLRRPLLRLQVLRVVLVCTRGSSSSKSAKAAAQRSANAALESFRSPLNARFYEPNNKGMTDAMKFSLLLLIVVDTTLLLLLHDYYDD